MKKYKNLIISILPLFVYLLSGVLISLKLLSNTGNHDMALNLLVLFCLIVVFFSIIYGAVGYRMLKSIWKPAIINTCSIIIVVAIKNVFDINLKQYVGVAFNKIFQSMFKEFLIFMEYAIPPLLVVFVITFVVSFLTKLITKKRKLSI